MLFRAAFLCCLAIFNITTILAQTITWGSDFRIENGSTDLEVIATDESGVYVNETHLLTRSTMGTTLIKLEKDLSQAYQVSYNADLKDRSFGQFFFLKNKLFMLTATYNKKEKTQVVSAAEIDKSTGRITGGWQPLCTWQKNEKADEIEYHAVYNADSNKMIIVGSIQGDEGNTYEVKAFDSDLKAVDKPISIANNFEANTYALEDLLYTSTGNIIMVGHIQAYEDGKKREKFLRFVKYNITIYNKDGRRIKEIDTDIPGKFLLNSKLFQTTSKELIIAAFYCKDKKGKQIDGMLVQRINAETGAIINTSNKEISGEMVTKMVDDDKSVRVQKDDDEELSFSKNMRFRALIVNADKSIVILAEEYKQYISVYRLSSSSPSSSQSVATYDVHECGNLLMTKLDNEGNISWLHVLPKFQKEKMSMGIKPVSQTGTAFIYTGSIKKYNRPFYAGFNYISIKDSIHIIFNDNSRNHDVLEPDKLFSAMNYPGKPYCYMLNLDANSGNYTRSVLIRTDEYPTSMPRLGAALNNEFYMIGKSTPIIMFAWTRVAAAKVTFD